MLYDVVVIGLGVVGASIARELSRFRLKAIGIDASNGFASGATRANSGIVHAGHDALPGTLKAKYNVEGNSMYTQWSREMEFPFQRIGSLVVFRGEEDKAKAQELYERGLKNGVAGMEWLSGEQVKCAEPSLKESMLGALLLPSGGITCPYEFCVASAENARQNGTEMMLNANVRAIEATERGYTVYSAKGNFQTKTVVNAAGVFADEINNMVCERKLSMQVRKGEYLLLDNESGAFFHHTIFHTPTKMGKGVLITPTVDGNLILGPTSEDTEDKTCYTTTAAGMSQIKSEVSKSWDIPDGRIITQFTGLRAHLANEKDFVIGEGAPGFFNAAGIESPGLTAAPAIARHLAEEVAQALHAEENKEFDPIRPGIRRFREMDLAERREAIRQNPQYSNMICRCELVTEAEVVEAVRRGAVTMDAVKRYTRAGMGKCQRGFCGTEVLDVIARETGMDKTEVLQDEAGTNILVARIS